MPKPNLLTTPLVDPRTGLVRPEWLAFFQALGAGGGSSSLTTDDLAALQLVMTGTSAAALRTIGSRGLARQVLHGNPTGAPTWGPVRLQTEVVGTLSGPNGGTGHGSNDSGDILYGMGAGAWGRLPAVAAGSVLQSVGVGIPPVWGDPTADPTAQVSFEAQVGSATTCLRSDAAPRLASTLVVPEGEDLQVSCQDDLGSTSARGSIGFQAGNNDTYAGASVLLGGAQTTEGGSISVGAENIEVVAEANMECSADTFAFIGSGSQLNLDGAASLSGERVTLQCGVDAIGGADHPNLLMIWNTSFGGGSDARIGVCNAIVETTDATPTELEIGSSAFIELSDDSFYLFECHIAARRTSTDDECAAFRLEFAIRRGAGAANTAVVGTPILTTVAADAGAAAWTCGVVADTTNGRPTIAVTGEAAKTVRWNAKIMYSKVAG